MKLMDNVTSNGSSQEFKHGGGLMNIYVSDDYGVVMLFEDGTEMAYEDSVYS